MNALGVKIGSYRPPIPHSFHADLLLIRGKMFSISHRKTPLDLLFCREFEISQLNETIVYTAPCLGWLTLPRWVVRWAKYPYSPCQELSSCHKSPKVTERAYWWKSPATLSWPGLTLSLLYGSESLLS